MSDELQTEEDAPVETGSPAADVVESAAPAAAAKPKAKAPAKRKAPAKPKAPAKGKTSKVKYVGPADQQNATLAQHGYRSVCEPGKVYELPVAVAAKVVKGSRHFEPVKPAK